MLSQINDFLENLLGPFGPLILIGMLGVTIVLDRAGITGPDGPSHHGMWDISIMGLVPGLRLAAPRDAPRLTDALAVAVGVGDAPTVVRYSKDALPEPIEAIRSVHGLDIVRDAPHADVLIVAIGQFVQTALQAADRLARQGISARVVDPLWALPIAPDLVELARPYRLVVSLEDNITAGGFGWHLRAALADVSAPGAIVTLGIPDEFIDQASRTEILDRIGLTPQGVARTVTEKYIGLLDDVPADLPIVSNQ